MSDEDFTDPDGDEEYDRMMSLSYGKRFNHDVDMYDAALALPARQRPPGFDELQRRVRDVFGYQPVIELDGRYGVARLDDQRVVRCRFRWVDERLLADELDDEMEVVEIHEDVAEFEVLGGSWSRPPTR